MKPQAFIDWANREGYDTAHTFDTERSVWLFFNPMTADLFRAWGAALDEAAGVCEPLIVSTSSAQPLKSERPCHEKTRHTQSPQAGRAAAVAGGAIGNAVAHMTRRT